MTAKESALDLAKRFGWSVFRLRIVHDEAKCDGGTSNCKEFHFLDRSWAESSTNDPAEIEAWDWSEANGYGVDCRKSGLAIVDVDPGGVWRDETRIHGTGRGVHFVYLDPDGRVRNSAKKLRPGVDVRGAGGFVAGPGSWHPHGAYDVVRDIDPVRAPVELYPEEAERVPAEELPELGFLDAYERLQGVFRHLEEAVEGERNVVLNSSAYAAAGIWARVAEENAIGELSEETIKGRLYDLAPPDEPTKSADTIERAWEDGLRNPMPDEESLEFFDSTPVLRHIRDAAQAQLVSPGGYLVLTLGRVLAEVPPDVMLPGVIGGSPAGLNLGIAIVAGSGGGKSSLVKSSRRLLGLVGVAQEQREDGMGSGEGLIDKFLEPEIAPNAKGELRPTGRMVLVSDPRAILIADEVEQMGVVGKDRKGSTLNANLRTALTGGALKQANAKAGGRSRRVSEDTYRLVVLIGVQEERSDVLLSDSEIALGTPQRLVWCDARDPDRPVVRPPDPGSLDWTPPLWPALIDYPDHVADEVIAARERFLDGETGPRDGHLLLTRLKVAFALAALHDEIAITDQWWELAGRILDTSEAVQERCLAVLRGSASRANAERARAEAEREAIKLDELGIRNAVRDRVREIVGAADDGISRSAVRKRLSGSRQREVFDRMVPSMVETGDLREESYQPPGGGRPGRRLFLGVSR